MKPQNNACPECGGPMVSRVSRKDQRRFWGCADYPTCKGTRNTDGESWQEVRDRRRAESGKDDDE